MSTIVRIVTNHLVENRVKKTMWQISSADIWIYGLTFIPGVVLLAAVWFQTHAPIVVLMKDPLVAIRLTGQCCHVYYGFVSNVGIMLWTTGAAVCLFSSLLLFSNDRRNSTSVFLGAAGIFTGWLALDDFFMIHEDLLPLFGVPQLATYAIYASAAALYILGSWRNIVASRPALMALALALLGTSVVIDALVHTESPLHVFVEDGAKFLGILAWTSFHVTAALELVAASLASPRVVFVSGEA